MGSTHSLHLTLNTATPVLLFLEFGFNLQTCERRNVVMRGDSVVMHLVCPIDSNSYMMLYQKLSASVVGLLDGLIPDEVLKNRNSWLILLMNGETIGS